MISRKEYITLFEKGYDEVRFEYEKKHKEDPAMFDDIDESIFISNLYRNLKSYLMNESIAEVINENPYKLFRECVNFCCMKDDDRRKRYADGEYKFYRKLVGNTI